MTVIKSSNGNNKGLRWGINNQMYLLPTSILWWWNQKEYLHKGDDEEQLLNLIQSRHTMAYIMGGKK